MAANIAVKDRGTAEAWVAKASALNKRADDANRQVGALLRQLDDGAAGDVVDTLVQFGNKTLDFSQQIFDGVTKICDGITEVVNAVEETVSTVTNVINTIASSI